MFKVGMKVAHPMHGVGFIERMESREVLGEQQSFYVLNILMKNIRILVPVGKGEAIGLRKIHEEDKVEEIFGILAQKADDLPSNWNRRYKINLEKLKSGDIMEAASVLKNLEQRRQEKNLSSIEKKMYYDVRNILVGELVYSKNIKTEQAEKLIDQALLNEEMPAIATRGARQAAMATAH